MSGRPKIRQAKSDGSWMEKARCRGEDTSQFFPPDSGVKGRKLPSEVIFRIELTVEKYCDSCPVKSECLDHGIETKSEGVWGGIYIRRWDSVALIKKRQQRRERKLA